MKPIFAITLLAGLSLAIGLIAWNGFGVMADVLTTGGWLLLWLAPCFMFFEALDTVAWQSLCVPGSYRFGSLYFANWVGCAVNWLLPVGQVGGDALRARFLIRYGMQGTDAVATVIVDKTLQAVTLVFYALIGLGLLILHAGEVPISGGVLVFALLLTSGIFIFYRLQQKGIFSLITRFVRMDTAGGRFTQLVTDAAALDAAVLARYQMPRQLLKSLVWRMLYRLAMAGEVYLALYFLGHPVGFIECIILQSLGQAVRAAAFLVPGALGIQEGGYLVLGMALGLSAEVGLALSLAKRLRELLVGLPGLMAWQLSETRHWRRSLNEQQSQ
ncbi:MAG: HpnL family protein [Gammaproteobacteria bacterium]|nr:HpnL family protein [Gammaproteobacteria bacterium]